MIYIDILGVIYFAVFFNLGSFIVKFFEEVVEYKKMYKEIVNDNMISEDKLMDVKRDVLSQEIKKIDTGSSEENQRQLVKVNAIMDDMFKFGTNNEYKENQLEQYQRNFKIQFIKSLAINIFKILVVALINLIPILILYLTGSVVYGIVASGLIMILTALVSDFRTRDDVKRLMGEEYVDEVMTDWRIVSAILIKAVLSQIYFFIAIIIFKK